MNKDRESLTDSDGFNMLELSNELSNFIFVTWPSHPARGNNKEHIMRL